MSVTVEKKDGNVALLTIECSADDFEKAMEKAYQKAKGKIRIDGFRQGKAPRAMIEKMYGPQVFYEDAANVLLPDAYEEAMKDEEVKKLDIVSSPEIDVKQMEKGKTFIFTAHVALRPEVTLGQYKDFKDIKKEKAEVTDEDLNKELDRIREQNSRLVPVENRPVAKDDTATIDFEGFIDGVPFDGGKGEDYDLVIGSHSFIDTFEDQLIGKNKGDDVDVNVTFPEDYQAENLKGKPALFKVKIKDIKAKELPELNDEFADEVSDFSTLNEYKEDLKKKLQEKKEKECDNNYRDAILKKAVENAKMDIPEQMIKYQANAMVREYGQRLRMQGLSLEMFLQYTGQTMEQMEEQYRGQAEVRIKNSLVLEAIAEKEKIEVSDEEVDQEIEKMAKNYGMDVEEIKKNITDEEKSGIRKDLSVQKAMDKLSE